MVGTTIVVDTMAWWFSATSCDIFQRDDDDDDDHRGYSDRVKSGWRSGMISTLEAREHAGGQFLILMPRRQLAAEQLPMTKPMREITDIGRSAGKWGTLTCCHAFSPRPMAMIARRIYSERSDGRTCPLLGTCAPCIF
jgi:hypothetical protein